MTGTTNSDPAVLPASLVGRWLLDADATTVELHTKAMWGMAKVKGTFAAIEGAGALGEDGSATGTLIIDAASVDTGQARRDKHLRSGDFFDVDRYPTFSYTATSALVGSDGSVAISGAFTARGQTHEVLIRGTVDVADADRVTLTAEADLDRTRWGMSWKKLGARVHNHVIVVATFVRP